MLPSSVYYGNDLLSCKYDLLIEVLYDVMNQLQFSNGNDIVGHVIRQVGSLLRDDDSLGFDFFFYSCHEDLKVEYVLRDNLLLNDDMTNVNYEHSDVSYNIGSAITLEGYQFLKNLQWCDDTPFDDENHFLEDDSTLFEWLVFKRKVMYVLQLSFHLKVLPFFIKDIMSLNQ